MKISLIQQVKFAGLTLAVAALSHQPNLTASAQQIVESNSVAKAQSTLVTDAKTATEKSASFVDGTGHSVTGGAKVIEEAGQRYLELDSDFRTDSGPDLFVLLHRETVPISYADSDYINLGRLQRVARTQRYLIPADVDISAFRSAVIWCRQFNETFGYAAL